MTIIHQNIRGEKDRSDGAVMPDPVESSTHMLIHPILNKQMPDLFTCSSNDCAFLLS